MYLVVTLQMATYSYWIPQNLKLLCKNVLGLHYFDTSMMQFLFGFSSLVLPSLNSSFPAARLSALPVDHIKQLSDQYPIYFVLCGQNIKWYFFKVRVNWYH